MTEIQAKLFAMQDPAYRDFQSKLMPTVEKDTVIGVRTPMLRRYAKQLSGTAQAQAFLADLPHTYYEENNLHAFLIEQQGDLQAVLAETERFLPHINNWATCDSLSPKLFAKNREQLLPHIHRWIASEHTYTVRFGIECLMRYFLDDAHFSQAYPEAVAGVQSEEYYVNMMIAWYFATALAYQYQTILPYLKELRLSPWVHAKTIQKAIESDRISGEQKQELRLLR